MNTTSSQKTLIIIYFLPVPYCFKYYNSVIYFEIRKWIPSARWLPFSEFTDGIGKKWDIYMCKNKIGHFLESYTVINSK